MNQRDTRSAIYLSGIRPIGYVVHHDIPGEVMALSVPSVSVGNAIVQALRERQKTASKGRDHAWYAKDSKPGKRESYSDRDLPRRDAYGTQY